MKLFSLDLETHITQPGIAAPPIVCVSTSEIAGDSERVYQWELGSERVGLEAAVQLIKRAAAGEIIIGGQTIDYDTGCIAAAMPELLEAIYAAFERGTFIAADLIEKLHRIAIGTAEDRGQKNDLVSLEKRYLGIDRTAEKENGWRLRYHELQHVPLSDWPDDAVQYPRRDARGVLDVLLRQLGLTGALQHKWEPTPDNEWQLTCALCGGVNAGEFSAPVECPKGEPAKCLNLHCVSQEMRMCLVLRLSSIWGLRTDPTMVEQLVGEIRVKHEESRRKFFEAGIVRVRPCNKKDGEYERADDITPEMLDQFEAIVPPDRSWSARRLDDIKKCRSAIERAKKNGSVRPLRYAEDKGWLKDLVSVAYKGDPPMTAGGESGENPEVSTSRDTLEESGDPLLEEYGEAGVNEKLYSTYVDVMLQGTSVPINFGFNSTLSSQRVSLYEPNLSQLPRKGGIRECFTPRGYLECTLEEYAELMRVYLAGLKGAA